MRLMMLVVWLMACSASIGIAACSDGNSGEEGFTCPDGENPDGNGCYLPCEDGWHEGPAGECLADCPTIAEENEGGECEAISCTSGWSPASTELIENGEAIYFCTRDCPAGTTMSDYSCTLDCGEGWSVGSDERCHLDCPIGMTAGVGVADCTPDAAGENKICPGDDFDLSISGPNPVFVDAASGLDTNDGSQGTPFATIGHAIAVMGDSATVYLAAGVYPEYVLVEGKTEFNLVGRCAADVHIEPPEPAPESHGDLAGAIQTFDTGTVRINGVTVASPGYGIRIEHTGAAGTPDAVMVDQVRVDSAAGQGIRVNGHYDSTTVANASVTQAAGGIACLDPSSVPAPVVQVQDSHVFDLLPGAESDDTYASGIEVIGAYSAEVTGNLVEHLARTVGITTNYVRTTTLIESNSVRDLQGGAGIANRLNARNPTISDNVITDVVVDPDGWDPFAEGCPFGIRLHTALPEEGLVTRTAIARIQGVGLEILGSTSDAPAVELTDNEVIDSAAGVVGRFESLVMTGNRMDGVGSFLFVADEPESTPTSDFVLQGNSFSNRAAPSPAAPSGSLASTVIDSYAVFIFGDTLLFEGNTMYGNAALPGDAERLAQLQFQGGTLTARDNSITEYEGDGILAYPNVVEMSGNRLLFGGSGLILDGLAQPVGDVIIDNNMFWSLNDDGVSFFWDQGHGAAQLTANTFGLASIEWGWDAATPGASLIATGNHFDASGVWIRAVQDVSFQDNLLTYSGLYFVDQPEGSALAVDENGFRHSGVILLHVAGDTSMTGNGFGGGEAYYGYGVGIGAIDSAGPLTISRNVFWKTEIAEIASVGQVGDGIQVVGGGSGTPVDIRENLFRGNRRAGLLLNAATGTVEGNMYLGNGTGPEADLVLQASEEGAVEGYDTGFATAPDEPYGVLLKENLGWE